MREFYFAVSKPDREIMEAVPGFTPMKHEKIPEVFGKLYLPGPENTKIYIVEDEKVEQGKGYLIDASMAVVTEKLRKVSGELVTIFEGGIQEPISSTEESKEGIYLKKGEDLFRCIRHSRNPMLVLENVKTEQQVSIELGTDEASEYQQLVLISEPRSESPENLKKVKDDG